MGLLVTGDNRSGPEFTKKLGFTKYIRSLGSAYVMGKQNYAETSQLATDSSIPLQSITKLDFDYET